MHSPLPSPSLRAMTHAHHLAKGSYFSPIPSSPSPPRASPYIYPSPNLPSPRANHTSREPVYPTQRETPYRPMLGCRRPSFRESAIPLKPTPPSPKPKTPPKVNEDGRRRPSFKIDLPPRQNPVEMAHVQYSAHTPFPITRVKEEIKEESRNESMLRDPFHIDNREYVILQARDRVPYTEDPTFIDDCPSPSQDPWSDAGLNGLGYTLNKLRAPTPWIRGKEDSEWLTSQDMDDMEGRMRGLGLA